MLLWPYQADPVESEAVGTLFDGAWRMAALVVAHGNHLLHYDAIAEPSCFYTGNHRWLHNTALLIEILAATSAVLFRVGG